MSNDSESFPRHVQPRLLVVDDEPDIRETFIAILEAEDYEVRGAGSVKEGSLGFASFQPHMVLLDLGLPDGHGLELLERFMGQAPSTAIVVVTAEKEVETAVRAMRMGAMDYLEKPIGLDRLVTTARICLAQKGLREENLELRVQALANYRILGHSGAIRTLLEDVERIAGTDLPVLITGENGTGKELVARHVHLLSERYRHPFLATNCAAVPDALIEAEFFGHVKGAYTGADHDRLGLFLEAERGTLFLDEIGEMPPSLQARLLRVLQEKVVTPIGTSEVRPVDCRIVAATNKDLSQELREGRFREDLYYRIRGVELRVPALRERREDIPLLAQHFLENSQGRRGSRQSLAEAVKTWLMELPWLGNVRQLQSLMQSAAVLVEAE
ncbi:MAG: sigma-54-dependent transcriptional regulator, partial [Planctomycetota bacterium]